MKKVVIFGAGGHAKVIADIVTACGDKIEAFLIDNASNTGVVGSVADYEKFLDCEFVIGIGNASIRERLSMLPVKWYTAIHPTAVISSSAVIGEGTVIMPNAVVNAGALIGKHCIINTGSVVEHDNSIEDFVHISVGAKLGGSVHIGKSTWVGIGATVSNSINVCADCMIGAGAVVVKNIDKKGTYVGVPAKLNGGGYNRLYLIELTPKFWTVNLISYQRHFDLREVA